VRHTLPIVWSLLGLTLAACPSPDQDKREAEHLAGLSPGYEARAEAQLRATWATYLAAHPGQLRALLDESPARGGWVKFYSRDYPAAVEAFEGATTDGGRIGLGRSHLRLAELYDAVFQLALDTEARYLAMWEENAGRVPKTATFEFVAGRNALLRGDAAGALEHLTRYRGMADVSGTMTGAVAAVLEGEALELRNDQAGAAKVWASAEIERFPEARWLLAGLRPTDGPLPGSDEEAGASPYARRNLAHALTVRGEADRALKILGGVKARDPDHVEEVELPTGRVTRRYYDPLVLRTLAMAHARKALEALGTIQGAGIYRMRAGRVLAQASPSEEPVPQAIDQATLPVFLFSSYPTPADLARDRAGEGKEGGSTEALGFYGTFAAEVGLPEEGAGEDRVQSRRAVGLAQAWVDMGRKIARESGTEEGATTVAGLKVIDADVARAIRNLAHEMERRGRRLEALYLLEHVLEKDQEGFSYQNEPRLFVDITRVYCSLGRYREAMNYFYRLVERYPEMWLVQETLGNLSVLGTVDQAGRTGQQD